MTDDAPFRELVRVESVPPEGWRGTIEAPPEALAGVARRLRVPKVIRLRGAFELYPMTRGLRLSGVLDAALVRECVASLEPVDEVIHEAFAITFSGDAWAGGAVDLDPEAEEPEPLTGDTLDLADILIQQLSLAMVPYPRKPGGAAPHGDFGEARPASPFDVLKSKIAGGGEQG